MSKGPGWRSQGWSDSKRIMVWSDSKSLEAFCLFFTKAGLFQVLINYFFGVGVGIPASM